MTDSYVANEEDNVDDGFESQTTSTKHMLTKVRISNFKRIKEAELEIGPVTYIVGGNNSGKSSAIQAIHTAVTAAQVGRKRQQQVIPTSSLRYSPAAGFESIGHGRLLENKADGHRAIVEFSSQTDNPTEDSKYRVALYRGRNYDSIGVDREPKQGRLADRIQDPRKLFSIYTPGLSGIPLREEYMSYASVFQRAAGGEANLVFRNILRLIDEGDKLHELENAISTLIGEEISIYIDADEEEDFYITVKASIGDDDHCVPVELWGTGLLQITQLYSYVILFQPSVFLADEPDAHLHPSRQRILASAFDDIAENYGCQVIAATHSEHLISSRPENTKLIWMRDGESETYDREELIPLLMHLGCLDEVSPNGDQILLLTEDQNHNHLTTAINRLGKEGYHVKVIPVNGVSNLGIADTFVRLKEQMSNCTQIVIHRDRDFLIDDEIEGWLNQIFSKSTARPDVFVTRYCDMEAYYCSKDYILRLYEDEPNITDYYDRALRQFEENARKEFAHKREANNKANFLPEGGSPTNQSLWPDSEPASLNTVVGKKFLKRLIGELKRHKIDISRIGTVAPEELLIDLRAVFDSAPPSTSSDDAHDLI
ncbi:AAA family ATPase [uncultured Actinomyces sp.]|uniref:AAA family ATPase n=1 Tax=uncultured Actinomyces sp. TaxID=249061 RepID=UPI00325FA0DE